MRSGITRGGSLYNEVKEWAMKERDQTYILTLIVKYYKTAKRPTMIYTTKTKRNTFETV